VGRIGSGVFELVAAVLLLVPGTVALGALLSLAVAAGAIASHLLKLGIELSAVGDHGELFALAVVVLVCSLSVLVMHRQDLPVIGASFRTT
jgi:putative oxidoreductase